MGRVERGSIVTQGVPGYAECSSYVGKAAMDVLFAFWVFQSLPALWSWRGFRSRKQPKRNLVSDAM